MARSWLLSQIFKVLVQPRLYRTTDQAGDDDASKRTNEVANRQQQGEREQDAFQPLFEHEKEAAKQFAPAEKNHGILEYPAQENILEYPAQYGIHYAISFKLHGNRSATTGSASVLKNRDFESGTFMADLTDI
ncbi:MAG: hypothetical protein Q7S51_02050 [Gallionellaceae bacterium]|nr:hypothetical protein [Gallionellaceae bacterium]